MSNQSRLSSTCVDRSYLLALRVAVMFSLLVSIFQNVFETSLQIGVSLDVLPKLGVPEAESMIDKKDVVLRDHILLGDYSMLWRAV